MISLLLGFACMAIGFGLLVLGLIAIVLRIIFASTKGIKKMANAKVNGLGAAAVTGIATATAYKAGFKDGKKLS